MFSLNECVVFHIDYTLCLCLCLCLCVSICYTAQSHTRTQWMIIAVQNMRDIASFTMVQAQYIFIMSIVTLVMNCRFSLFFLHIFILLLSWCTAFKIAWYAGCWSHRHSHRVSMVVQPADRRCALSSEHWQRQTICFPLSTFHVCAFEVVAVVFSNSIFRFH